MHSSHHFIHGGEIVEPLQAQPEGLGSGFTVAFASEKATETGYHPRKLTEGGGMIRRGRVFVT
jgi:hypothetical protein